NYDDDTLEAQRCVLVDAMKKKGKDMELIQQKMDLTFSFRRKEIVEVRPVVSEIQERWLALFLDEKARTFLNYSLDSRSAHVSVGGVAPQCSFRGGRCLTRRQRRRVWQHPAPALPPLGEFQFPARQTSSPRSRRSSVDVARCECSAVDVARSCCSAVDVAWSCGSAVDVIRLCGSAVDVIRLCGSAVDLVRRLRSAVDVASDPLALPSGPLLPPLETSWFHQATDPDTKVVKMGILTVLEDDDAPASQSTVINTAIVLEEVIVLTDLPDISIAFAELFGLLFALNMESKNNTK
ncbi:hypothetical protein QTP70_016135, partial [Hemibagrus guttatus]